MKKQYKLLCAVLASSFVVAILALAFTPAPVEAKGPPVILWQVVTDTGESPKVKPFLATRKVAKKFCGVDLCEDRDGDGKCEKYGMIEYISKDGTDHNICRFK